MQTNTASIVLMDNFFNENRIQFFDELDFEGYIKKSICDSGSETIKSKYIVDIGKVFQTLTLWKEHFPKVGLVYKASSNLDELIIKVLNHQNIQFTTFSAVEIEKIVSMGVEPENIRFASICKINRHIKTAESLKVNMLTFCSENELRRIATLHPSAKLCLRLTKLNDLEDFDMDYFSVLFGLAASFGMQVTSLQIDLEDLGKSSCLSDAFQQLCSIISYFKSLCKDIKMIYVGSTTFFSTNKFGSDVISELSKQFSMITESFEDIEFLAESGDILLNSGTQLLCTVAGVKVMESPENGESESYYYLNDGVYGSFGATVYGSRSPSPVTYKMESDEKCSGKTTDASLWGPTCDSIDKICSVKNFPVLEIGDVVAFDIMGAGCRSSATYFNGFEIPDVEYVVSYQWLDFFGLSRPSQN